MSLLQFSTRTRMHLVRQAEAAECGLAALAMVASYHGYRVDLPTLRLKFGPSLKGMTLRTVMEIAAGIGLGTRALRCEPAELNQLRLPAILHWGMNHFVVLESVGRGSIVVLDPAQGRRRIKLAEIDAQFTGVALELSPNGSFRKQRERTPMRLSDLVQIGPHERRVLGQVLVLSLVFELLVLLGPFYVQLVIDQALVRGDASLLVVLALAFAGVLAFRTIAQALRALTAQFISRSLTFDMQARLFFHLLRLPLEWFHKRQVGDIQIRFQSIDAIQTFLSNGALVAFIDALLGSVVLALMIYYSVPMTAVVLGAAAFYALSRAAALRVQQQVTGDLITARSLESSRFLESIRAAETIKGAGAEGLRDGQQRNLIARTSNASIRAGNVSIFFQAVETLVDGAADILLVFIGAHLVLSSKMTVGMLTAFIAYKAQLSVRLNSLVEQVITWRILGVHLERLSDIAMFPNEPGLDRPASGERLAGAIRCTGLYFAYGFGEPAVLRGLDLAVEPGEYVAVTGASGCGKTTLIKLITGLYRPVAGEILLDGRPLLHWGARTVRRQIAIVSQDDVLLAGSIAENISFFDELVDDERLHRCARMARIHDEIAAMPMGYQSLVGDMGSTLSGGQKQRVLLARALYREPTILVLDEGTSHLDVDNERAINEALATLSITRIVVAHRPETIRSARRIIRLEAGRVVADRPGQGVEPGSAMPRLPVVGSGAGDNGTEVGS